MFSPLQKRVMVDSMMESRILPCDRMLKTGLNSPLTRKLKEFDTSTTSFRETDSVVSSCMLTSGSVCDTTFCSSYEDYSLYTPSPPLRSSKPRAEIDIADGKIKDNVDQSESSNFSKPSTPRRRDVDWGDRSSIRFSISFPKYAEITNLSMLEDKANNTNYFKICYATEFSDEEDYEDGERLDCENVQGNDRAVALPNGYFANPYIQPSPVAILKRKKSTVKINFLSDLTHRLIGEVESYDGFFSLESLLHLTLAQIQLVLNDLIARIAEKNAVLLNELCLRDDLQSEKTEHREQLDNFAIQLHSRRVGNTPLASPICRSPNVSDSFDPPTLRYPYNVLSPQTIPSHQRTCPNTLPIQSQPTSPLSSTQNAPVSKFKYYLTRIFSGKKRNPRGQQTGQKAVYGHSL